MLSERTEKTVVGGLRDPDGGDLRIKEFESRWPACHATPRAIIVRPAMSDWGAESLLRRIADNLAALREETHALHEQQKAHNSDSETKPTGPLPIEITNSFNTPAINEHYEAENRKRKSKWRWVKPFAEGLGIVCALALAMLTYCTLREVITQTENTRKSAEAAKSAAELSLQTARGTIAAHIIVQNGNVNRPGFGSDGTQASFVLRNDGKLPARDVSVTATWICESLPSRKELGRIQRTYGEKNTVLVPQEKETEVFERLADLPKGCPSIDVFRSGDLGLIRKLVISYNNGIDDNRMETSEVCGEYFVLWSRQRNDKSLSPLESAGIRPCDVVIDILKNAVIPYGNK
jgi:hypothetical protein